VGGNAVKKTHGRGWKCSMGIDPRLAWVWPATQTHSFATLFFDFFLDGLAPVGLIFFLFLMGLALDLVFWFFLWFFTWLR
jgi:hypothetical protein